MLLALQIRVVPHEMGACYLTATRHRYILDIMEEVRSAAPVQYTLLDALLLLAGLTETLHPSRTLHLCITSCMPAGVAVICTTVCKQHALS